MIIRSIHEDDSENILSFYKKLDRESQFMLYEPHERVTSVREQRQIIRGILSRGNQTIFVAEQEDQLVGVLEALGGTFLRNRHCAYIVIGILQAFAGQGLGTHFFQELEDWAIQHDLHRLELTVMRHNEAAVHLYQKMGFVIEGTRQDSLLVNGRYVDEYYMAKILGEGKK